MKAQISTEMIIILAIILALILIVATNLQRLAKTGEEEVKKTGEEIFSTINATTGGGKAAGEACGSDAECGSGTCLITGFCA